MTIAVKRKKNIALLKAIDVATPEVWARKIVPEKPKNACPICGNKPNNLTRYNKKTQNELLHGELNQGTYQNAAEVAAACGVKYA